VVRRDVTRLVTPGTLTEEKLLDPSQSNFLMALARVKGAGEAQYGLAWIDISTGAFHVGESRLARLLADIARVEPRELILADNVFHDPELRPLIDQLGRVAHHSRRCCLTAPRRKAGSPGSSRSARSTGSAVSRARNWQQQRRRSPMSRRPRSPSGRRWAGPSAKATARGCSSTRRRGPASSWCARCRANGRAA
jgi:hypothetical protein